MTIHLKGTSELFPKCSVAGKAKSYSPVQSSSMPSGSTSVDRVQISQQGIFSAKLAEKSKECAQALNTPVSSERIARLKQEYAGTNCPVSPQQIAGALQGYLEGTK